MPVHLPGQSGTGHEAPAVPQLVPVAPGPSDSGKRQGTSGTRDTSGRGRRDAGPRSGVANPTPSTRIVVKK
jgi:hypothetical protein